MGTAIYRSLDTPEPRNPRKVSKRCSRASRPGVPKKCRKSPRTLILLVFLTHFQVIWDLFRHFFDTPGREAREHLFETFRGGFGGSGAWRLLYIWRFPSLVTSRLVELQGHPTHTYALDKIDTRSADFSTLTSTATYFMGDCEDNFDHPHPPYFGHFFRGRSLKGRCNIRVYVPLCVFLCVCPSCPPHNPAHSVGLNNRITPHPYMTPHPRSRICTRKQLRDLPLGRTTP